jgi:gas vesicle protein
VGLAGGAATEVHTLAADAQADLAQQQATMEANQGTYDTWQADGTGGVLPHTGVGAATAALGGGNVLQGALVAGASEAAIPYPTQYGNNGVLAGTTLIGGLVGGGAGASAALAGTDTTGFCIRKSRPRTTRWQRARRMGATGMAESAEGAASSADTDLLVQGNEPAAHDVIAALVEGWCGSSLTRICGTRRSGLLALFCPPCAPRSLICSAACNR